MVAQQLGVSMLTQRQIQSSVDVSGLFDTAVDCRRFVTEFFDVIHQSAPHIYHSALLLAPRSSVVWSLYSQQICSPVSNVINGTTLWDSCTADAGIGDEALHAAWSPCGRLIAVAFGDEVQLRDSHTLEKLLVLNAPRRKYSPAFGFLAFSPDGHLLVYSRKIAAWLVVFSASVSMLTPVPRYRHVNVSVWDVQTGVASPNVQLPEFVQLVFSGNCGTINLLEASGTLHTYDGLSGTRVREDELVAWPNSLLNTHWVHEEALQFLTGSEIDGQLTVNIQELHLTSTPLFHAVESFTAPPYDGSGSVSPASLHTSFVTKTEVVILDLQSLGILLQAKAAHSPYAPPGCFSPNGCFFACGTDEGDICVWKNGTPNYVAWSNIRPRLSFEGFSFSPTRSSILAWGPDGVQLLELNNHTTALSPNRLMHHQQHGNHLVTGSTDVTHIAIARQGGSVITVLGTLSNTPQLSFNTKMQIMDIKIVADAVLVIDGYKLASWHLKTGELVCGDKTTAIDALTLDPHFPGDCSEKWFSFSTGRTPSSYYGEAVSLQGGEAQKIPCSHTTEYPVECIRFSPDGHQLWFLSYFYGVVICMGKMERGEGGRFVGVGGEHIGDKRFDGGMSWVNRFSPNGWYLRGDFGHSSAGELKWIVDSSGNKLLWLPLGWRVKQSLGTRWDSNLLAFVGCDRLDPIIIQFQL